MLLSDGFLETARERLGPRKGLSESDLRRAVSDLYFAMFHTVCETLASILQNAEHEAASKEAWLRLYRLPDHAHVAKQCDDGRLRELPNEIQQFAGQFKAMKTKREDADYDASKQFKTSEVRKMLELVESAVNAFKACDHQMQLKFAVFASVKKPRPTS